MRLKLEDSITLYNVNQYAVYDLKSKGISLSQLYVRCLL